MMIRSSLGSPFYMDSSRMFMWMYRYFIILYALAFSRIKQV